MLLSCVICCSSPFFPKSTKQKISKSYCNSIIPIKMYTKTLLPALAVFGAAVAQTSNRCNSDAEINAQADADLYASCTRINGDVVIGSEASNTVALNGPRSVTGSFRASNATQLFSISSNSIESIGGTFELNGLEQLSTLSFEQLTSVGDIKWTALGNLGTLTFPATVSTAKSVVITNTFLSTLDGINLDSVDTLDISNNRRLTRFSTQVKSISSLINIATNNADLSVELPNLIWAKEMTFRNLSSVSIPSLAVVNGSLGFYATYMESLSAPNLTTVGNFGSAQGSLSFVANEALANVTLPKLSSIGGAALIANNTVLQDISLPELTQVAGAVDFSGVFTTPELPKLNNVRGAFNMQSKSQIDCSGFQKLKSVIQGKFTCTTTSDAKSADGTSASGTGSGGTATSPNASATSTNAAVAFGAGEAVAGMSVLGALFSLLL